MARGKYLEIVRELSEQIRSGEIRPGERLPTHRELAYRRGLSLGTATRVYTELFALGLVTGEVGRGTFARAPVATKASSFHYDREGPGVVDLSRNFMVLPGQAEQLASAAAEVIGRQAGDLLHYQPHAGRERDREAAAAWLTAGSPGTTPVEPSRIIICNGGQHALTMSLLAATQPGDTVAVEACTYPGLKVLAGVLRLRLAAVEMDADGIVPSALDALCRETRIPALYCMPTLQNPLGVVMPAGRRAELADVVVRHDLRVIEDDAYGLLVEDAPPSLASMLPDRTYYVQTLSKSLAPGLRVAFLVAPEAELARLTVIMRATTWTAPPLMAGVATQWISDGTADRTVRQKRLEAKRRQDLAKRLLAGFGQSAYPAGLHLWLTLPPRCRTDDLLVAARERGVLVSPASLFAADERVAVPQAVRLCLGAPGRQEDLERALRTLADVLDQKAQGLLWTV
jgi:DNA-binding transcriptional MocR family regulator